MDRCTEEEKKRRICDFLEQMADSVKCQKTDEDAEFWANIYNGDMLLAIKEYIEEIK